MRTAIKIISSTNDATGILYTGLRRGELFRLKWEDIDFRRDYILLPDPKGGTSETIPLNKQVESPLKLLLLK